MVQMQEVKRRKYWIIFFLVPCTLGLLGYLIGLQPICVLREDLPEVYVPSENILGYACDYAINPSHDKYKVSPNGIVFDIYFVPMEFKSRSFSYFNKQEKNCAAVTPLVLKKPLGACKSWTIGVKND